MNDKVENKKEDFHGFETLDDFKSAKKRFFIAISMVFVTMLIYLPNFYSVLNKSNQISIIEEDVASSSNRWVNEKGGDAVNTIKSYNKCVDGSERGVKLSRSDCLKGAGEEFYKIVKDAVEKSDVSESVKKLYMTGSE